MKKLLLTILLVSLFINSCKSGNTAPNCGCESETVDTVPSENVPDITIEVQMSGLLFHNQTVPNFKFGSISPKNEEDFEKYNNRFWLYQEDKEYDLLRYFALCPNHSLPKKFEELKNNTGSVYITFTGKIKNLCDPVITLGIVPKNYLIAEMEIISIETQ